MDTIHRLREVLSRLLTLSSDDSHHGDQELFEEIMVQKPRLLKLFDVGPRSAQEQKEVESGKISINGTQVAVNSDFARQVLFIAQHLDCSEKHVASVLHTVMRTNLNLSPVEYIEATVTEFHERRRALVDSIQLLLTASLRGEAIDASSTLQRLSKFVRNEILPSDRMVGGETSFAYSIFKQIGQLDTIISRADAALKNALTDTVSPSLQSQGVLGHDLLKGRIDSLTYERRQLAISLATIARHGALEPSEIRQLVDWLSENPNHPMTFYTLATVFLSFEPHDPDSRLGAIRQRVATDQALMTYTNKKFAPSTSWKDPALKAAVLLKWTMFITDARHNDSSLEHHPGFKNEELEAQVWNAVQGDAFTYLALTVARISRKSTKEALPSSLVTLPVTETTEQQEIPTEEPKLLLLGVFETLVRSLITYASSELRKIKQKQEDLVFTDRNRASSRFGGPVVQEAEKQGQQPRHDIAIFFSFIGLLFSALPAERALQFWGAGVPDPTKMSYLEYVESTSGRLPAFLQWAVWSASQQDLVMLTALYDMITGLANGTQCSELAYNFMARGNGEVLPGSSISSSTSSTPSISWTTIFATLDAWMTRIAHPKSNPQPQPLGFTSSFSHSIQNLAQPPPTQQQQLAIGPKDVLYAQSFLRLLGTVVRHSVIVRATISSHNQFRAIPTLVSLIPLGIPLELKGALFDVVSAFCEPNGGYKGQEICKAVWGLMEKLEVINVRGGQPSSFSTGLTPGKGVEVELEQIEAVHKVYPATIPFLNLLTTLIHTAKRLPEKERATGILPANTIPENLGHGNRLPGVMPFTSFVLDNVFANIAKREYAVASDRWRINDLCLCYVERALASFNLETLVNDTGEGPIQTETLVALLIHPGFDITARLLSSSPLQASLLSYLVEGVDGFEKGLADEEAYFRNTITRVLRIVTRLLEIQDTFLDVLLPLLSEFNTTPYISHVHHRSYFTKFDQALSFDSRYAPAIAQYIEYYNHSEAVLLAIRTLTFLSTSPYFTDVVTLIERSPNSERILAAFEQTLDTELADDISQAELDAELRTGAGAPSIGADGEPLSQAIRLAALDLLIQDTSSNRKFPNIGHWLLFGGSQPQVQDPHALNSRRTSIHVLLELVNDGVPRLKDRWNRDRGLQVSPLYISLPALAERCYRVIYQLCTHPRTSEFVTRYLRTREDFFARQISNIPSQVPECRHASPVQVVYGDGSGVITTVDGLSSFLRLRSYIFDLVALELHMLTSKGHHKGVVELLEILFGTDVDFEEDHDFPAFREVGQSNMRIVDFFQSLLFEWADSLQVTSVNLQFLSQLNLQASIRKDANGCDVVDRPTLLRMLASAKQVLFAQGSVATKPQGDQLEVEATYIMESCAIENHRRQIAFSVAGGFESWRRLLDLALTKCFDRLPHDRRENMLFDLLHVLPPAIRSPTVEEPTAVLLSETTLSLITKLREDRRHQLVLQSSGTEESSSLPAERLFSILRSVVEGILDSNHSELIRGNLYGSLINFVHLVMCSNEAGGSSDDSNASFALEAPALHASSFNDSRSLAVVRQGTPSSSSSARAVELGVLSSLKPALERLVTVIARDAIDGTEVWKTVAFMLLDAIVQLSSLEKPHAGLVALDRHGILSNFVRGIKDSDGLLQSVLKPDPDDLNPLYVYESKMSLFIRMAQTRLGAEKLLEACLIPILAQCDYLDAMPESDQSFMDYDSFLPSAIQRYHQLFIPAIQVVNGIITTVGNKHTTTTSQALEFLSNHSSTIAILLKTQTNYVTLPVLEEIHLVVNLCASVLPSVPRPELLSGNSGFGVIHAAILSLSTRCLGQGKAYDRVIPHSDTEVRANNVYAFGHGSSSKFDVQVRRKERSLHQSVISYIGSASDFTEPEINLVLSPVTITPKRDEQAGLRFSATVPTIGDALAALDDLSNDLGEVLKQISDIGAELASKHHLGSNEIQEILRDFDSPLLQDLEVEQTRSLVYRELWRIRRAVSNDARVILDSLEMLMLLIWRHLQHYAEPRNMNLPPAKFSVANAMRLLQTSDPASFREEAAIKLGPVLQKLNNVDLAQVSTAKDWQESQGYIEIMCRRLKDTAGLLDEVEGHSPHDPSGGQQEAGYHFDQ